MLRPSTISSVTLAVLLFAPTLRAQEIGGYAGAFLRRSAPAREIGIGGAFVPFRADASSIFSNSAALAGPAGWTGTGSVTFLANRETLFMAGIGRSFGAAGVGLGVVSYGVDDVAAYSAAGQRIGLASSRDLALSAGAGLRIGPGAIGATVRYLRFDATGTEGTSGYAVDISGTMQFEGAVDARDWVFASIAANNIAGAQSGAFRPTTANVRLGATYVYPLGDDRMSVQRPDPTGISIRTRNFPDAYVLGTAEVRAAQYDPLPPAITIGFECATAIEQGSAGLRAGFNSRRGISAGGFVRWQNDLLVDYGASGDETDGTLRHTIAATVTW